jgi:hypothetical protein
MLKNQKPYIDTNCYRVNPILRVQISRNWESSELDLNTLYITLVFLVVYKNSQKIKMRWNNMCIIAWRRVVAVGKSGGR